MSNEFIEKNQEEFNKTVEHFKAELNSLRTGRANPAMVENILVDSYGAKTPLRQLGSIGVPEARTMTIEPWDKSILKDIEKALTYANLGVGIQSESTLVRVTIPQMTEDNRKNLVKLMNEKLEDAKIAVRGVRENVRELIMDAEKNKAITEDDKFSFLKELEEEVGKLNDKIREMAEKKEKEIMSV